MSIEGTKQCFPLMMYGFYSDDALYLGSFSFAVFIFTLSHFDTWHCYYFESSISVLIYIKVLLIKKHKILFCSLLNMKKQYSLMFLFSCWFRISQVQYCQKKFVRSGRLGKKGTQVWSVISTLYHNIFYTNVMRNMFDMSMYERHWKYKNDAYQSLKFCSSVQVPWVSKCPST